MRVMVVGSGAREHALLWKLAQSPRVAKLICAPGNAGTASLAENLPIRANDVQEIVGAATEQQVDLVVIGPEEPLAHGIVDHLREAGVRVFGPTKAAARIESSKSWAKGIMTAAGVPTARAAVARTLEEGMTAISGFSLPVVIKADGLAAGKGVVIPNDRDEAFHVLTAFLEDFALGAAASTVVIEEYLTGQEVSVLAITDGSAIVPLAPACDYKRAFDRDRGPNTGGMGAYAPVPAIDPAMMATIQSTILEPTIQEMTRQGIPMQGVLYAGLMMTADGPKVLEFNARFGDPETQVVLPLIETDLADLLFASADGTLASLPPLKISDRAAVGIVLASGGYPGPYRSGLPISGLEAVPHDAHVFHAGTRRNEAGRVVTAGGRVLTVVGTGNDLSSARERAYQAAAVISFDDAHQRGDIASREVAILR